jgi:hypothetical protein
MWSDGGMTDLATTRLGWTAAAALVVLAAASALVAFSCSARCAIGGTALSGRVQDTNGVPLPSVWIRLEGVKNRAGLPVQARTDGEGRFTFADPPKGEITLRVMPGEVSARGGTLHKTRAGVADLVIELQPSPMVTVRIRDHVAPEGDPRYARLTWLLDDGRRRTRYAPIGKDGLVRFVSVPKDAVCELWAVARTGRPVWAAGLAASEKVVALTSEPGRVISGTVVGPTAADMRRVRVAAERYPHFKAGRVELKADGSFSVTELPEGTYRLRAAYTSGAVSMSPVVEAKTGSTTVELVLR